MLSFAFLAIAGIGGWPYGGQAVAIGAIWLPGRLSAQISSWFCKNIAARFSLEAGHSPVSSQCGRLKPREVSVNASTQTQPRYWPVGGWVAGCCVSKAQPVGRVVFGHLYFEYAIKLIPLRGKLIYSAGRLA